MGIHNWISGPSARRTKDLLKLNRDQLRWIVGLFTGHCHLKGHLFKLGLMDDTTCERCLEEDESATHVLCDCEAIAHLRFCHLSQFFMEPSDFYDAPISKVLHFIRSVGLIHGQRGPDEAHPSYIHSMTLHIKEFYEELSCHFDVELDKIILVITGLVLTVQKKPLRKNYEGEMNAIFCI
jgi:hypothetical protein